MEGIRGRNTTETSIRERKQEKRIEEKKEATEVTSEKGEELEGKTKVYIREEGSYSRLGQKIVGGDR